MLLTIFRFALLLFLLAMLDPPFVYAQRTNYFTLPAWTNVSKVPWRKSIYRFQEFQKGKITYTKGFALDYEFDLNYNVYYEKMDFINLAGDTLSITNTGEIRSIQVGNKTFFHEASTGYYEVLVHLPVALAFRNQFFLEEIEFSNGARSGAIPTDLRGVVAAYDRIYRKRFSYFFVDQNNELSKATRTSVLKLFPEHNTEIKAYLLEHGVDFESREDLIELTIFCNQFVERHKNDSTVRNRAITVRVAAGRSVPSKTVMDSLYRFPEFREAKVTWNDKSSSFYPGKMNYNLFTGNMDIVDGKSDTVKFSRWSDTKIVNLDGDIFFRDLQRGYLEILLQGEMMLAVKSTFVLVTDKAILEGAGFKDQVSGSSVSYKTLANHDRLYQLQRTYYLLNRNQAHEANKLSILKLMPKHRDEVIAYINENNVSFSDEQDLMWLTTFCNGLLSKN
ncbi:MAG TPA: hypothetical protein VEW65_02365 [Chryseolinea sp.]|nr:hypothetical protein [Chryseolinea sp.]